MINIVCLLFKMALDNALFWAKTFIWGGEFLAVLLFMPTSQCHATCYQSYNLSLLLCNHSPTLGMVAALPHQLRLKKNRFLKRLAACQNGSRYYSKWNVYTAQALNIIN